MSSKFVFGRFQLDCLNDELTRDGNIASLTPKAFALLRYLVESRGRLVRSDELMDVVWPGVVVGDAALKVCISEIRKALHDHPRSPQYIQTVHKRGYRFIAAIEETQQPPEKPGVNQETELFGRNAVFERLDAAFGKVLQGQRQLIFLSGEPGIGKTSVVNAFSSRALRSGQASVGHGFCIEHNTTAEAYLPVLSALGDLCRQEEGETFITNLERCAPSWLMQMPALLDSEKRRILSLQIGELSRDRMLRELAEGLEVLTRDKPLVLVLEDLHWSDSASIDFLAYFARRTERARLLIVATYRPVDVILSQHPLKKLKQSLLTHGLCEEIPLELLGLQDIYRYLAQLFPRCNQLDLLAQTVFQQSEGNPLFMVNITTYLVACRFIVERDGAWHLRQDIQTVGVSESLRGLIVQQLENQDEQDQDLLKLMSVAGMRPRIAEVAAATRLSVEEIESRCDRLEKRSVFIRFSALEEWPDGTVSGCFEFNHALYQSVLYHQLSPTQRMRFHLAIGKRLANAYSDRQNERALDLAEHFTQGREFALAIKFWRLSAENSISRHAYHEATAHIDQGLALLKHVRDQTQRMQLELALCMTLGPILIANDGNASPRVERTYRRACELCERSQDDSQLFPALFGLRSYYQFSNQLSAAHDYSRKLLQLAENTGDEDHRLEAYVAMASTHFFLGELQNSAEFAQRGMQLYDQERHRTHAIRYGLDPGVFCLTRYAQISWMLGFPERAVVESHKAEALAEEIKHNYSMVFAINIVTMIHLHRLDANAALASAEKGKNMAKRYGFAFLYCWSSYLLAWSYALAGQNDQAFAQLQYAFTISVPESRTTRDFLQVYLAEIYFHLEMPGPGLQTLDEVAINGQEFIYKGERSRLRGEFLLMQGKHAQAEIHFKNAVQQNADIGAKSFQLRAALPLARLWKKVGRTQEARALLKECCQSIVAEEQGFEQRMAASLLGI